MKFKVLNVDLQVPVGGCYRLIDIPMSNCINSGINKIFVLTQFNSASLNRHIARTYGMSFGDGFVEVQTVTRDIVYRHGNLKVISFVCMFVTIFS